MNLVLIIVKNSRRYFIIIIVSPSCVVLYFIIINILQIKYIKIIYFTQMANDWLLLTLRIISILYQTPLIVLYVIEAIK